MAEDWNSDVGWVGFYNAAHTDFSPSFKEQFSIQLNDAFNALTEIEDFTEKLGFLIIVGMSDMKIMYQDGYGFGLLELITPISLSIHQTFYWKTDQVVDAFKVDNYTKENIEFGFCADFDKEIFLKYHQEDVITKVQSAALGFRYTANFNLFPDLTFSFTFKENYTDDQVETIEKLMDEKFTDAYVSKLSPEKHMHQSLVDFQGTTDEEALFQINELIRAIITNPVKNVILSISIN